MQILFRLIKSALLLTLFLLFMAFAIKNDGMVRVKVFFDAAWDVPLVIVMLTALVSGVLIGLLALAPSFLKLRQELAAARQASPRPPTPPISPTRLRGQFSDISDSF